MKAEFKVEFGEGFGLQMYVRQIPHKFTCCISFVRSIEILLISFCLVFNHIFSSWDLLGLYFEEFVFSQLNHAKEKILTNHRILVTTSFDQHVRKQLVAEKWLAFAHDLPVEQSKIWHFTEYYRTPVNFSANCSKAYIKPSHGKGR